MACQITFLLVRRLLELLRLGQRSWSRQGRCCAGTGSSSLGPGPTLDMVESHPTPWTTRSLPAYFAWHGRTRAGATSASWVSAASSVRCGPLGDERAQRAPRPPPSAGTTHIGALVAPVPSSAGCEHSCLRLLPCRHRYAAPALCAVLYRPRAEEGVLSRRDRSPRRGLGHPASS